MRQATTRFLALLFSSTTLVVTQNSVGATLTPSINIDNKIFHISLSATNLDGLNVREVRHSKGFFQDRGNGKWIESSNDGTSTFDFLETRRAKHSVYLEDKSRNVYIQLNLSKKTIVYSDINYEYDLYKIISIK